jgi:hypothetical protein
MAEKTMMMPKWKKNEEESLVLKGFEGGRFGDGVGGAAASPPIDT